jgi:hypothetical protein
MMPTISPVTSTSKKKAIRNLLCFFNNSIP